MTHVSNFIFIIIFIINGKLKLDNSLFTPSIISILICSFYSVFRSYPSLACLKILNRRAFRITLKFFVYSSSQTCYFFSHSLIDGR